MHGASGMAGVGKTFALIALGHDKEVRGHFKDGVLFMSLGANASVGHITRGLSKIMKFTGARASADAVERQTSLAKVVEDAALWFLGKRIFFWWTTFGQRKLVTKDLCRSCVGFSKAALRAVLF